MSICAIKLSEKQIQWLDAILMDEDQQDALRFCEEIKKQIREQQPQKCGPKLLDPVPK